MLNVKKCMCWYLSIIETLPYLLKSKIFFFVAVFLFSYPNVIVPENYCTCSGNGFEVSVFRDSSGSGHSSVCSLCEVQFDVDVVCIFSSVYILSSQV